MRKLVLSIENEYRRYRALAEATFAQLTDDELCTADPGAGNSIAVVVWHVAGNLESRFSDFLASDGEKPWRDREAEFAPRTVSRAELLARWEQGWSALLAALAKVTDADLGRTVTIRRQPLLVHQALHRSLSHTSYHVGQIVHIGKCRRGDAWAYLSIPPGQSADYNRAPDRERPDAHAAGLGRPKA